MDLSNSWKQILGGYPISKSYWIERIVYENIICGGLINHY